MMIGLRPILSDSVPKTMKNGVPISSDARDHQLRRGRVDLQLRASGRTARRTGPCTRPRPGRRSGRAAPAARSCRFFHWPNDSVSGAFEVLPSSFIFLKAGDSFRLSRIHTETPSRRIETRNGMRQPQSVKAASPRHVAHAEDDDQRQEQAERGRGLDPRGVGAALAVRRMLGHVGRGTAVLAAERQALQQAQARSG